MTAHSFHAMGTTWWVTTDLHGGLARAEATVRALEARLSRFLPDSAVARLRHAGTVSDAALASVVRAALSLMASTDGAFSVLLGRELEALGYDRSFEALTSIGMPLPCRGTTTVRVDGDQVAVDGDGWLDVGGIAKGWAVDQVSEQLRAEGAAWGLVDGGGDLRGWGRPWVVGVPGELSVTLDGDAVATSSTLHRRWTGSDGACRHHILTPSTGLPADGPIVTATVRAADACTADALATALIADAARTLPLLTRHGASALLVDTAGNPWTTPSWKETP